MSNLISPIDVSIELTSKCNLSCIHCLQPPERNGKELTTTEYFRIADELSHLGVFEIFLTGGEPLLNPDWDIIGEYLINLGFTVGLSTNGCFIDDIVAKKILDKGLYKSLQVSIDGSNREVHESMRGVGSYSLVMNGLDNLAKYGIYPNIAIAVTKKNINDVLNVIEFAVSRNLKHVHIISLMPIGNRTISSYSDLDVPLEEWIKLEEELEQKAKKYKDILSIDWTNRRYLPKDLNLKISDYSEIDLLFAGCPAGKTKALIDYTGDVYGCDVLKNKDFCAGNIRTNSFKNIWYHSDIFQRWRNRKMETIQGKCINCKWLFACVGGCPAISIAEGLSFNYADPSCPGHN